MTKDEQLMAAGFDHPCKKTCSGWEQGRLRGEFDTIKEVRSLRTELANKELRIEQISGFHLGAVKERDELRALAVEMRGAIQAMLRNYLAPRPDDPKWIVYTNLCNAADKADELLGSDG